MTTESDSREHLSCLMDGELTRETGLFVIRRVGADETLAATWKRYHLVRDCLRRPGGSLAGSDFAARLSQALDDELAPGRRSAELPRWLRPVASAAMTAAVAVLAVALVRPGAGPDGATGANEAFTTPAGLPLTTPSQPASYSPTGGAERARLDAYLMRHNQVARSTSRQGFVSFLPVVVVASENGEAAAEGDAEADRSATQEEVGQQ